MNSYLFLLLVLAGLCSCQEVSKKNSTSMHENPINLDSYQVKRLDPHSFANAQDVKTTHLDLTLEVDFNLQILKGVATYTLEKKSGRILTMDSKGLSIEKITDNSGRTLLYKVGNPDPILGEELKIYLNEDTEKISIAYQTGQEAPALQWTEPSLTASGTHPFLFTQSQAILARSWIPCQDSPGIRFTYSAKVSVPKNLMAVMSASNPTALSEDGVYTFEMKQPIPAYLMALAVGDLAFQPLGERTGVYAEKERLEAAVYEFGEVEKMLITAEKLYGTYPWERYDILLLPPSFPFGGMENPRLTFATPTILAGDRSLTSLVAHELAHSWSGNLVTNATWDDFWLNEGFTVYFELRIMEEVFGKEYSEMLALISKKDLDNEMIDLAENPADTHLKLDLIGRDPDEGLTSIAYDKGYLFLRCIEENVGRASFDAFLKNYFQKNAFQSMNTENFLLYLTSELLSKYPEAEAKIAPKEWIYKPGIPAHAPKVSSKKYDRSIEAAQTFLKTSKLPSFKEEKWFYQQYEFFLRALPEVLDSKQMDLLETNFQFSKQKNNEILFHWLVKVANSSYEPAYPVMKDFLDRVGRRKFILPIYKAMCTTEKGKTLAKEWYKQSRSKYHYVSRVTLDELLK